MGTGTLKNTDLFEISPSSSSSSVEADKETEQIMGLRENIPAPVNLHIDACAFCGENKEVCDRNNTLLPLEAAVKEYCENNISKNKFS